MDTTTIVTNAHDLGAALAAAYAEGAMQATNTDSVSERVKLAQTTITTMVERLKPDPTQGRAFVITMPMQYDEPALEDHCVALHLDGKIIAWADQYNTVREADGADPITMEAVRKHVPLIMLVEAITAMFAESYTP